MFGPVLQTTVCSGFVAVFFGMFSVAFVVSARSTKKNNKKHTDTQQALQRHSIVIICYSISFICCENCLGPTESTSRLGRKLYGFDFDTVSLFIVVFLFSICIRYR